MINKLKPTGSNQTELHKKDGTIVFFSYETPVCVYIPDNLILVTNKKYSNTTSRHINQWLEKQSSKVEYKDQTIIDTWIN